MKKVMHFLKSTYLIVIGIAIGATVLTVGALSIPTNIDNSVQTIKTIYISSDGVSTTGDNVFVKIDNTSGAALTVKGNMNVGDKTNVISGRWSSIAGGEINSIVGNRSMIAGGTNNSIKGDISTVGGGYQNVVNGNYSVIPGGYQNVVTGAYSIAVGGYQNNISGDYSFAGGYKVNIQNLGVFAWSDSKVRLAPNDFFRSVQDYTFIIRAYNGVAIGTGATVGGTSLRVWDGTNGKIAAQQYCDENGANCIDASSLITFGTGSGGGTGYRDATGANVHNNNTGDIAVGTSVFAPTATAGIFQVNGSMSMSNGTDRFIKIYQGKGCIAGSDLNIIAANASNFTCGLSSFPGGNATINGGAGALGGAYGNVVLADAGGYVGVKTATPTEALDVSGSVRIRSISAASTANNVLVTNATGEVMYAAFASVMSGNGYRGKSGSNMYSANTGNVGIGTNNPVATLTVIGSMTVGSSLNQANGINSIAMGYSNIVNDDYSAAIGGTANQILGGRKSFIGGGSENTINSPSGYSSILGGRGNHVGGDYSSIIGGYYSVANGNASIAMGANAIASHDNTFVRNDTNPASFTSSMAQQFIIHANNGVGINTSATSNATLTVDGTIRAFPQDFTPTCDANKKGSIYYYTVDNHFYGCNGSIRKQLDN